MIMLTLHIKTYKKYSYKIKFTCSACFCLVTAYTNYGHKQIYKCINIPL